MYLFNEPPVSESEVQNYLDTIPNLSALPSRREAYRRAYNVEEKIRAAKRAGQWPPSDNYYSKSQSGSN